MSNKIEFKQRKDIYDIKLDDEFSPGGVLYKAMANFDVENNGVLVCCYKDYPNGDFDWNDTFFLSMESILLELRHISEMKVVDYFSEKFEEYGIDCNNEFPPCEFDNLYEMYTGFLKIRWKKQEKIIEEMTNKYVSAKRNDILQLVDYFENKVIPFSRSVCKCYAVIHGTQTIAETLDGQRDKEKVERIIKSKFPWLSSDYITDSINSACRYVNKK